MNRSDFEATSEPLSLKELVKEEVFGYQQQGKDGQWYPKLPDESLDDIMKRVYEKIEREALVTYHSNAPWALRAWALSNILKEQVQDEAANEIAHGLISPVIEWQNKQPFDPIAHFQEQLKKKAYTTKEGYLLTASRFVAKNGRKMHYTDEEIRQYISGMADRYKDDNTYYQECVRLRQFLRRLPGADKNLELPIDMPKMPKKKHYVYAFTLNDIETLIYATVIDNIHYSMVVRLIGSTVYGRRVTELTNFQVHLDGDNSTVLFPIRKGGEEVPHLIPKSLVPLFSVPIEPVSDFRLQRRLKQICKLAGIKLPYRGGYHSFRRTVATVVKKALRSDIDTYKFMRWAEPRALNILAQYDQTRYEEVDRLVLDNHPIVKIWEQVTPYLLKLNTSYQEVLYDNAY